MRTQDVIIPAFAQMLEALAGQIDKAKSELEHDGEPFDQVLSARLAADMLPLSSQIHFVCLQAEEARARLAGEAPAPVDTAPTSYAEARALIASTVRRLRATTAEDQASDENAAIELELPNGMIFDFSLAEYLRSWSIPQFYFHLVTAYAIMRYHGVGLGKADYVPHMLAFLRHGQR